MVQISSRVCMILTISFHVQHIGINGPQYPAKKTNDSFPIFFMEESHEDNTTFSKNIQTAEEVGQCIWMALCSVIHTESDDESTTFSQIAEIPKEPISDPLIIHLIQDH